MRRRSYAVALPPATPGRAESRPPETRRQKLARLSLIKADSLSLKSMPDVPTPQIESVWSATRIPSDAAGLLVRYRRTRWISTVQDLSRLFHLQELKGKTSAARFNSSTVKYTGIGCRWASQSRIVVCETRMSSTVIRCKKRSKGCDPSAAPLDHRPQPIVQYYRREILAVAARRSSIRRLSAVSILLAIHISEATCTAR